MNYQNFFRTCENIPGIVSGLGYDDQLRICEVDLVDPPAWVTDAFITALSLDIHGAGINYNEFINMITITY